MTLETKFNHGFEPLAARQARPNGIVPIDIYTIIRTKFYYKEVYSFGFKYLQVPPELDSEADTPLNKGKIYISKTSPSCVLNAYLVQFQKDFSLFLKSRSKEVVAGGRMVLSFLGRLTADPTTEESCHHWELLAHAINEMVLEVLSISLSLHRFSSLMLVDNAY